MTTLISTNKCLIFIDRLPYAGVYSSLPAAAASMLANMLAERGEEIPTGTFIMTGGITAAVAIEAGDSICVRYEELGAITINVV